MVLEVTDRPGLASTRRGSFDLLHVAMVVNDVSDRVTRTRPRERTFRDVSSCAPFRSVRNARDQGPSGGTRVPKAHRRTDTGSDHGCHFPPSDATGGSPDVFVNGLALMRVGDAYAPHGCPVCPQPAHGRALAAGSGTVFVNGQPAGRVGDAIDCGGAAASGSGDVSIGD